MRRLAVIVALVAGILALVPSTGTSAVTQQFTWFDQVVTHTWNSYFQPTQSAATPSSWTSPHAYTTGRVYARIDVTEKKTAKPVDFQICVWRNSYTEESCSFAMLRVTTPGVYYKDFGAAGSWWKKGGSFSWTTPFSPVRIMVKDPDTGMLMMTGSCGDYCSTPEAVAGHIPITADMEVVVTAAGATLEPPAGWGGCPTTWSAACATLPTTTTTTTTAPPPPPFAGEAALLVGDATTVVTGDVPVRSRLESLGWNVTLVDDDALAAESAVGDPDLIVISSSVVPSKIPAWMKTRATPILNGEAYIQYTMGFATSPGEQANQTSLSIDDPGHPLAAGLSGTVPVQAAASMARANPVAGADVIARMPGAASPSLYGIETGTALTSGTAPARRVGFFTSYASQSKLNANAWTLFDAAVDWLTPIP